MPLNALDSAICTALGECPADGQVGTEDIAKDGINWYAYCAGDPVGRKDSSGLASKTTKKPSSANYGKKGNAEYAANEAKKAAYAWAGAQNQATKLSHTANQSQQAAYAWAGAQTLATNLRSDFITSYPQSPAAQYLEQQIYNEVPGANDVLRGRGYLTYDIGKYEPTYPSHRGIDLGVGGATDVYIYTIWYGMVTKTSITIYRKKPVPGGIISSLH